MPTEIRRIQVRRGETTDWSSLDPVLENGEPAYDSTTGYFRIGNGTDPWSDLPAFTPALGTVSTSQRMFTTVSDMLASTIAPAGAGAIWLAAHAMFEEADPTETTPHHTTAGGVKLMEAGTQFTKYLRFRQCVDRGWVYQKWDIVHAEGTSYVFLDDGNTDLPNLTGWAEVTIDGGNF